jgi:hypothetical protein
MVKAEEGPAKTSNRNRSYDDPAQLRDTFCCLCDSCLTVSFVTHATIDLSNNGLDFVVADTPRP